jgi:hypothetical protein
MQSKRAGVVILMACALSISAPIAASGVAPTKTPTETPTKTKVNCKRVVAALTDLSFQYQKLLFLDSADAWATTARDPLGGTLDGAKLRSDAKALAGLRSVKTTSLGFPSVKNVLANVSKLGDLVEAALASSAPFPGPGQDAYELVTERSVGDRAALGYASEQRGCKANAA